MQLVYLVLYVMACLCFLVEAVRNNPTRVNLMAAGLFCLSLALVFQTAPRL